MASAISSSIPSIISCTPSTIRTKCSTRSSIGQLKFPSKIAEALISDSPFGWSYTKCPLEGGPFSRVAQSRIRDLPIASATAASIQQTENSAESLVGSLLARVEGTDRGAMLSKEEHKKVAETVSQLEQFCIPEPLKSPLIFGGKLIPLDNKWIQITFESPSLKVGPLGFQYGGESTVKIAIIYVDERVTVPPLGDIGLRGVVQGGQLYGLAHVVGDPLRDMAEIIALGDTIEGLEDIYE